MSLYQDAYKLENIRGPGDERPTALQIIKDEGIEGMWEDKVILLTGSSSGLGIETARALAATGASLFLGVRSVAKAQETLADIPSSSPNIHLFELDLSDFASVRKAAAEFLKSSGNKLNVLVNNAGILAPPEFHTKDGLETQLTVHYWGPFLLFQLLRDALLASATPAFPSRFVNVTSIAHQTERLDFVDLHVRDKKSPFDGYGRSMLAKIYLSNEIERRYGASHNLHAYSLNPGVVRETGIDRHVREQVRESWEQPFYKMHLMNAEQGSACTVWAAVAAEPLGEDVVGKYLEWCKPADKLGEVVDERLRAFGILGPGYAEWAYDEDDARRLWEAGLGVVGLGGEVEK